MASSFPGALDNLSTGHVDSVSERILAGTVNDIADAVNKIERNAVRFFNVKDTRYNATGAGVADESAAFNAAIAAANAAGGGVVYVPQGTYRIKNIDILSNVTIFCAPGVTFKYPTSGVVTFDRLWYVGQDNLRVNIRFFGNGCIFDPSDVTGYGTSVGVLTGMVLNAARNFIVEGINGTGYKAGNVIIMDATGAGVHNEVGIVANIRDDNRTDPGYGCVQVTGARHIFFENLWCSGGYALNLESDRRSGAGTDFVEDIVAINLYAQKGASTGGIAVKFLAHGNIIRRIRVKGFRSVNSSQQGVYFALQGDAGAGSVMSDITLEDGFIDTPTLSGVGRQNGIGEFWDIPRVTFKNIRVVNGLAQGFQIGMSASLYDCSAEGCASEGFVDFSNTVGALPYKVRFINCRAYGNGTYGFMAYEGTMIFQLFRCESVLNGSAPFQSGSSFLRIVESDYQQGQSGAWYGANANRVLYDRDSTKRPRILGPWSQVNVAASQTNVLLLTLDPPGAPGAVGTIKMDRAGSIVALGVLVRAYGQARTAGTLTVEILKNGVALATPLIAILNATNTRYARMDQNTGIDTYVATDGIAARITTSADWTPVNASIDVWAMIVDD